MTEQTESVLPAAPDSAKRDDSYLTTVETKPRHQHAAGTALIGLFRDLKEFRQLETRIAGLPTE